MLGQSRACRQRAAANGLPVGSRQRRRQRREGEQGQAAARTEVRQAAQRRSSGTTRGCRRRSCGARFVLLGGARLAAASTHQGKLTGASCPAAQRSGKVRLGADPCVEDPCSAERPKQGAGVQIGTLWSARSCKFRQRDDDAALGLSTAQRWDSARFLVIHLCSLIHLCL